MVNTDCVLCDTQARVTISRFKKFRWFAFFTLAVATWSFLAIRGFLSTLSAEDYALPLRGFGAVCLFFSFCAPLAYYIPYAYSSFRRPWHFLFSLDMHNRRQVHQHDVDDPYARIAYAGACNSKENGGYFDRSPYDAALEISINPLRTKIKVHHSEWETNGAWRAWIDWKWHLHIENRRNGHAASAPLFSYIEGTDPEKMKRGHYYFVDEKVVRGILWTLGEPPDNIKFLEDRLDSVIVGSVGKIASTS